MDTSIYSTVHDDAKRYHRQQGTANPTISLPSVHLSNENSDQLNRRCILDGTCGGELKRYVTQGRGDREKAQDETAHRRKSGEIGERAGGS